MQYGIIRNLAFLYGRLGKDKPWKEKRGYVRLRDWKPGIENEDKEPAHWISYDQLRAALTEYPDTQKERIYRAYQEYANLYQLDWIHLKSIDPRQYIVGEKPLPNKYVIRAVYELFLQCKEDRGIRDLYWGSVKWPYVGEYQVFGNAQSALRTLSNYYWKGGRAPYCRLLCDRPFDNTPMSHPTFKRILQSGSIMFESDPWIDAESEE